MDIRNADVKDMREVFINQIIVDNIEMVVKSKEKDPLEAMKLLGFGILSDLDCCSSKEINYHIIPYQVFESTVDEFPITIHPEGITKDIIKILNNNDLGGGMEAMHNMYYHILVDRGLHTFPKRD